MSRELLQRALEALEHVDAEMGLQADLRAELAKPEPQPAGYLTRGGTFSPVIRNWMLGTTFTPLYTRDGV